MASSSFINRLKAFSNDSSFNMRPPGTNQEPWAGRLRRLPNKISCLLLRTIKSIDIYGVESITVLNVSVGSILRSGFAPPPTYILFTTLFAASL